MGPKVNQTAQLTTFCRCRTRFFLLLYWTQQDLWRSNRILQRKNHLRRTLNVRSPSSRPSRLQQTFPLLGHSTLEYVFDILVLFQFTIFSSITDRFSQTPFDPGFPLYYKPPNMCLIPHLRLVLTVGLSHDKEIERFVFIIHTVSFPTLFPFDISQKGRREEGMRRERRGKQRKEKTRKERRTGKEQGGKDI